MELLKCLYLFALGLLFNSDIVTDFPFSRFTSPVEGKQVGGGGGGVVVVVVDVVVYVERNSVIDI